MIIVAFIANILFLLLDVVSKWRWWWRERL